MNQIKHAAAIVVVAFVTFFALGQTAHATVDSVAPPPPVDVPSEVSTIAISAPIITLIVSAVIPLLTALVTRATTPSWVKALVMIVLNGVSALITSSILPDGSIEFTSVTFWTWLIGIIVSAVSYVVALKPNGLTSNVGGKLATVGVK